MAKQSKQADGNINRGLLFEKTDVKINQTFSKMLDDLQGNILKHHGRTHAYHIFINFKKDKKKEARSWISKFAKSKIVSASQQIKDSAAFKAAKENDQSFDSGVFYNFSLTAKGYAKLAVDLEKIPKGEAFRKGMKSRKAILKDRPEKWEKGLDENIDALLIVSDIDISRLTKEKISILSQLSSIGKVVSIQKGKVLRNNHGVGIEHFGYADGISQPNYLDVDTQPPINEWDDNHALLKNLLIIDEGGKFGEESCGSYFVFRKLEQNVKAFKDKEENISKKFNGGKGVKDANGVPNDELAGSMIVGRFEDGSEVVNHSNEIPILSGTQLNNDFDYRSDTSGLKCPFHSHIRITNPRADVGQDFAKSVRITRRGIPYNDIGRDEFDLDSDKPTGGVGLLFMCYNSEIERQFEFIQSNWANHGDIGGHLVGQDGIIGQGANATVRQLPNQWGTANGLQSVNSFHGFVTNKGGEYFFTPCISFLKSL
jgi:Dyp-type peroxidase family